MKIFNYECKSNIKLSARKKTTEIILHCAATPEGKDYSVEQIDKWHKDREFGCIGYQYVIYRNGEIHQGRPEEAIGAHTVDHNSKSIGICYIGGCAKDGKTPKDTRTDEQKKAQYELVDYLLKKYNLRITDVYGHRDFANKACPSHTSQQFRVEYLKWKDDKLKVDLEKKNNKVPICFIKNWF